MQLGLIDMPWWGYVVVTLILTHITIAGVTIYLHRHQSHRALELHAIPSHFFRFWLWLTTGMVTKEFAAIHRKHAGVGGLASRPQLVAELVKLGARYVSTGTDLGFLLAEATKRAKEVQDLPR